jgi:hypothetical protein
MATVAAPYTSGSIASISGLTVNVSGPATSAWIGRCIKMQNGLAAQQSRKIVAVPSSTQLTVDYAWTTSPVEGFTEVAPSPGDTYHISYYWSDLVDGTSIIKDPGFETYRLVGLSTFTNGVFVYCAGIKLELTSSSIVAQGATSGVRNCFRFGDIDANGRVYNPCELLDYATAPSGFNNGSTADCDFHFYGGFIKCVGSAPFWRFHSDAGVIARFIGVRIDGNFGGRIQGTRSIFKNCFGYNNQSANGLFNPKAPFGLIQGVDISNSLQALYHYWTDSRTVEAEGLSFANLTRFVRFANTTISNERLTVKDVDIPSLSAVPILYNNANGTYSNFFRIAQYLNASYVSVAGTPITKQSTFCIADVSGTNTLNTTTSTGSIPKQTLTYRDMTVLNTGDYTWTNAGGTTFAPYAIAAISYLYKPASLPLSLAKSMTVSMVGLNDTAVTETNKTIVEAYTTVDDLDRLYDISKAWSVNNLNLAIPSFGSQLCIDNGTQLNFGNFNIVVDSTASSLISVTPTTITIKSLVLNSGSKFKSIKTNGTISTISSTINVVYQDVNGVSVVITAPNLISGTRVQIYNTSDSVEIDNSVVASGGYKFRTIWSSDKTYRMRAAQQNGATAKKQIEAFGILTQNGLDFYDTQVDDLIYNAQGIDGATCTEFSDDYPNVQIDINDLDGSTSLPRIYAWYKYTVTTTNGIRYFFKSIEALDEYNFVIDPSIVDIHFDNTSATPVTITGGYIYRKDGTTVVAVNSGSIQMDPGRGFSANSAQMLALLNKIKQLTGLIPGLF